jgi:hypothetical protein
LVLQGKPPIVEGALRSQALYLPPTIPEILAKRNHRIVAAITMALVCKGVVW